VVAVGDSAKVELIFNTGRRKGGRVRKKATVTTNDNARGNFQLSFGGEIYTEPDSTHPIVLSQSSVTFAEETRNEKIKIKIRNQTDEKLKMTVVDQPYEFLEVDVSDKDIKPGDEREIEIEIADDFEGDNFQKSVTIQLNNPDSTRYTIPVELKRQVQSALKPGKLQRAEPKKKDVPEPSPEGK
jgi:hypothetical protein